MMTGYKFLYEKNILHRDIKPENILIEYLNDKPIYKLADFGVGKIYKHNDYKFTKRGTPVYSAPEGNILVVNDQELMLD
jgi:calcium-dependent protein kinase